jgi:hypothetical protein
MLSGPLRLWLACPNASPEDGAVRGYEGPVGVRRGAREPKDGPDFDALWTEELHDHAAPHREGFHAPVITQLPRLARASRRALVRHRLHRFLDNGLRGRGQRVHRPVPGVTCDKAIFHHLTSGSVQFSRVSCASVHNRTREVRDMLLRRSAHAALHDLLARRLRAARSMESRHQTNALHLLRKSLHTRSARP